MFWETTSTVAIIALLVASYIDLKIREVPDWLNYGLIFSALGIRAIFSVELGWNILLSGLIGFIVCISLAYLLYFTNQWGGGDSKLLMGVGAMIGVDYPFGKASFDLLLYVLVLLLLGAVYGLIWMAVLAFRKRKLFWQQFKHSLSEYRTLHLVLAFVSGAIFILVFFVPLVMPLALFPLGVFYLFLFVDIVEKNCFMKTVNVNELTEGDWLAEDLFVGNKKVFRRKTLENKDLWKLRQLKAEGKIKEVLIKEGIPFIPSFLFAYLFLVFGKKMLAFVLNVFF